MLAYMCVCVWFAGVEAYAVYKCVGTCVIEVLAYMWVGS
jgi:hypothetical protein